MIILLLFYRPHTVNMDEEIAKQLQEEFDRESAKKLEDEEKKNRKRNAFNYRPPRPVVPITNNVFLNPSNNTAPITDPTSFITHFLRVINF